MQNETELEELMLAVSEAAQRVWKKYPHLTAKEVETAVQATVRPVCSEDQTAKTDCPLELLGHHCRDSWHYDCAMEAHLFGGAIESASTERIRAAIPELRESDYYMAEDMLEAALSVLKQRDGPQRKRNQKMERLEYLMKHTSTDVETIVEEAWSTPEGRGWLKSLRCEWFGCTKPYWDYRVVREMASAEFQASTPRQAMVLVCEKHDDPTAPEDSKDVLPF